MRLSWCKVMIQSIPGQAVGMSSLKSVRESSVQMWLDRLRRGLQGWMKTKAHRVNPRTQNSEVGEAEPAKDSGTPNETGGSPDGSVSWKPGPGKDRNQIHTRRCVISPSVVSSSLDPMDCSIQAPLSMEFSRQEYWRGLPFPIPGYLLDPRIKCMSLVSPSLAGRFFRTAPSGKLLAIQYCTVIGL